MLQAWARRESYELVRRRNGNILLTIQIRNQIKQIMLYVQLMTRGVKLTVRMETNTRRVENETEIRKTGIQKENTEINKKKNIKKIVLL